MATDDDSDVPETGAVFTFGKSRFGDNTPNKFWIRNDLVSHVSCGDEHTALVAESGRIFTFGSNDWGQLGLGNNKQQTKPTCIKSLKKEKVLQVVCGRTHTLVATESGRIYSFGANGEGQLGRGEVYDTSTPGVIESLDPTQYSMLAAGTDHSVALTENGRIYVWGGSSDGQLGLGETSECPTPKQLKMDERVVSIACGYYHTALVTESGKLYTCGEPDGGKLGTDKNVDNTVPQHVNSIPESVVTVACGGSHTVAVTKCGKVYTFGDGSNGQLGHGNIVLQSSTPQAVSALKHAKVTYVSCGENHTAVITEKGQLYCFGDGRHGKLGLGEENFANQFKPSVVPRFAKFFVTKVSCGGCHMLALAHRKQETENGDFESDNEMEEEELINQKNLLSTIRREDDLEGTFSARDRRRQNSPLPSLNRTLPPLNSSLTSKSLPPLSATIGPTGLSSLAGESPLDRGKLPHIQISEAQAKKDERDEDSDVSLTPEGESDSEEEDINATRQRMKANSAQVTKAKGAPVPKPRPQPAPRLQHKPENKESDSEEDASEEDEEDEVKEDEKESEKKKRFKFGKTKKGTGKKDEVKKDEEKAKKGKKKKSKEDDEEESDEKKSKDKKKAKKKAGIFSRSKLTTSDEEDSEDSEEEEELEEVKSEKEKKSKDKKEKESKEKEKDAKDKNAKGKGKKEKEKEEKAKKEKEEKEKKEKEKKEKDKKENGKGKAEKKEEDEKKTEETPAEKDSEKNDKTTPKKEEKKKSSFCVIL